MQRSRKAHLQRRAAAALEEEDNGIAGRRRLYKVSLSLVLFLWGILFILNSLISHGNGYRGDHIGESTWREGHKGEAGGPDSGDAFGLSKIAPNTSSESDHRKAAISRDKNVVDENIAEDVAESHKNLYGEVSQNTERLSGIIPPGIEEFKTRVVTSKGKTIAGHTGTVIHRLEPGGKEYNYASAIKGAKILDVNKEAKGAYNILDKDKDKYLRNPCSAEEKYVVIELSEETLVDAIDIANLEHYSSNFKDFGLQSSLVYPTNSWVDLGNFTAANVKHAQRFVLQDPKWSRYLKISLMTHYGAEFYCTLSVLEVYGVDAVERMLEDLISAQNNRARPEEQIAEQRSSDEPADEVDIGKDFFAEIQRGLLLESLETEDCVPKNSVPDPIMVTRLPLGGRMPGDTVLKILMQKIRYLDNNFSVLERYLEELNSRYRRIFKEIDDDTSAKELLLKRIISDIKDILNSKKDLAIDIRDLVSWKNVVSSQLDRLVEDNAILRLEVEMVSYHHADMENRVLAAILISFVFGCLAATKLCIDMILSACRTYSSIKFCRTSFGWLLLLLSSGLVALILVL